MSETNKPPPSFNLWHEPWITLERVDGLSEVAGIEQALLRAHEMAAIDDPSPLVSVSIHRLLAAVLQDAFRPEQTGDVAALWRAGAFSTAKVSEFGRRYGGRFDLFSPDRPFMQTADAPLDPRQGPKAELKTVAYLTPEIPAKSEVTHFRHVYDDEHRYCPACAAKGLVMIPAFATSGGRGYRPSINGVPPIYVLPGGKTLFHALVLSIVAPLYQPKVAVQEADVPWWKHGPVVAPSRELIEVGYVQSLTFPARQVRLHPEEKIESCSRCGGISSIGVRTMIYEMGESRPKDATVWFDPFVSYQLPSEKAKKRTVAKALQPKKGRILWRDYAGLFMQSNKHQTHQPSVLAQLAELTEYYELADRDLPYPFRCVSLRTDKAKMFEWEDSGYSVSPALLSDLDAADAVQTAIDRAEAVERILTSVFRRKFGGAGKERARHAGLLAEMCAAYWGELAGPFRQLALDLVDMEEREETADVWLDTVTRTAERVFLRTADGLGDNAANLRMRVEGEVYCRGELRAFAEEERGGIANEKDRSAH